MTVPIERVEVGDLRGHGVDLDRVLRRLYAFDCQTCWTSMQGAERLSLRFDEFADGAQASLHHEACQAPGWFTAPPNGGPERITTYVLDCVMPLDATAFTPPALLVNPSLEAIYLRESAGTWSPIGFPVLSEGTELNWVAMFTETETGPRVSLETYLGGVYGRLSYEAHVPREFAQRALVRGRVLVMATHMFGWKESFSLSGLREAGRASDSVIFSARVS